MGWILIQVLWNIHTNAFACISQWRNFYKVSTMLLPLYVVLFPPVYKDQSNLLPKCFTRDKIVLMYCFRHVSRFSNIVFDYSLATNVLIVLQNTYDVIGSNQWSWEFRTLILYRKSNTFFDKVRDFMSFNSL